MGNQIEQWATSCIRVQGIAIVDSESIDTNEPPDSLHRVGLPVTTLVLSMDIVYFLFHNEAHQDCLLQHLPHLQQVQPKPRDSSRTTSYQDLSRLFVEQTAVSK